jgi:integrase
MHDKLKSEAWRVERLGCKQQYTWDDAGYKWLKETGHKRTHDEDMQKLLWLQQFLRGRLLEEIGRDDIARIGDEKKAETSAATANRYLALIRAILRSACYEWEWIERVPKVKLYRESARRVRWLKPEEARRLLNELPEHQRDIALFALLTGLRQANVAGLTWMQIDLQRRTLWIPGECAKAGEDIHVSLSDQAVCLLERRAGNHPERVFTYAGRPIVQVNTKAWRKALARAGIQNFRWHDLRHTWASWLVQHGTPLYELQEMAGWKSEAMVRRYAHLAPAKLAKNAAVVDAVIDGTNLAQPPAT